MNIFKQRFLVILVLLFCACQGGIKGRVNATLGLQIKQLQNPVFNLPIFNSPNGTQSGKLIFGKSNRNSGSFDNIQFSYINGESFKAENVIFFPSLNGITTIVYKQEKEGFYEILAAGKYMWIRSIDLSNLNIKSINLESYLELYLKKDHRLYLGKKSVALRSGSGNGFRKVLDLAGASWELMYKGQKVNNWVKVEAIKYSSTDCTRSSNKIEFTIEGWVELFDETGDLQIQFLPGRCP
jgi:hypothetical protein